MTTRNTTPVAASSNGSGAPVKSTRRAATGAKPRSARTRAANKGDTAPELDPVALAHFVQEEATQAAQGAHLAALQDIVARPGLSIEERSSALQTLLEGASPDDRDM